MNCRLNSIHVIQRGLRLQLEPRTRLNANRYCALCYFFSLVCLPFLNVSLCLSCKLFRSPFVCFSFCLLLYCTICIGIDVYYVSVSLLIAPLSHDILCVCVKQCECVWCGPRFICIGKLCLQDHLIRNKNYIYFQFNQLH